MIKNFYKAPILIMLCILSCKTASERAPSKIINVVGEIFQDDYIDDKNFKICNPQNQIIQYYAFNEKAFTGEKSTIIEVFNNQYKADNDIDDSGWVRIRFVVNCEGKAGRYRASGMGEDYKPKEFNPYITEQLLSITKNLNGWKPLDAGSIKRDYYQYLLFKIKNGKILEILP